MREVSLRASRLVRHLGHVIFFSVSFAAAAIGSNGVWVAFNQEASLLGEGVAVAIWPNWTLTRVRKKIEDWAEKLAKETDGWNG